MANEVHEYYGNRLRVRACGIAVRDGTLLMVNHRGLGVENFWAPPGGGIQFGENAAACLIREFQEETGLGITVGKFLFACELIKPPLHAIELFFEVTPGSGDIIVGRDPEPASPSIIKEVKFIAWEQIQRLPAEQKHGLFGFVDHPSNITALGGYFEL